ncbi:MAG: hypothetical protein SWO11_14260 [Thermodesulfobacteriota bacterium]|nr:hypothetical protein [Thermodesulfobacteriota bacterium]
MPKNELRLRIISGIFIAVLLLGLSVQSILNFKENLFEDNLSGFYLSHDLGAHILDSMDFKSTIITRFSNPQFLFLYLQNVEYYRPDVNPLGIYNFIDDDTLKRYVFKKTEKGIPLYWVGNDKTGIFDRSLLPYGLVFRFIKGIDQIDIKAHRTHMQIRKLFERRLSQDKYQNEYETYEELYRINTELFRYYTITERFDLAEEEFTELLALNRASPYLNLFSSASLLEMGKVQEAKNILIEYQEYTEILKGRTYNQKQRYLLYHAGILAFEEENYPLAEHLLKQAMDIDPVWTNIRYYLALSLYMQGRLHEAKKQCLLSHKMKPMDDSIELLKRIEEMEKKDNQVNMMEMSYGSRDPN